MSFVRPFVFVFFTVLIACSSTPPRPDWIDGSGAKYPADRYLVGRGQAATAEQAQDRARADLAKNFEVAVRVESEDRQSYQSGVGAGTQVSRVTATATEQVIQGVEIADRWHDPETGAHYALATLARTPAVLRLREETDKLDAALRTYVAQAGNLIDPLAKVGAASRAVAVSRQRDEVQKSLRVVDITGRGVEPQWSTAQLTAHLDALLKRVLIVPSVIDDERFSTILAAAVVAAGFSPETAGGDSFVLEGDLPVYEPVQQEGWYWARGVLSVRLIDKTKRVRGHRSWNIKAAGQSPAAARDRVYDEATKLLRADLRSTLVEFSTR